MVVRKQDYGRIISGSLKGRKIRFSVSKFLRPTRGMVREALFSAVYSQLGSFEGITILDGFCGSALIGLEFISRGAAFVDFVESDRHNYEQFRINIEPFYTQIEDQFRFWHGKLRWMLEQVDGNKTWDVVWLDPPFAQIPRDELADLLRQRRGKCFVLHYDEQGMPVYDRLIEQAKEDYAVAYQRQFGVSLVTILVVR